MPFIVTCDRCNERIPVRRENVYINKPEVEIPFKVGKMRGYFSVEVSRSPFHVRRRSRFGARMELCKNCLLTLLGNHISAARVRNRRRFQRRRI